MRCLLVVVLVLMAGCAMPPEPPPGVDLPTALLLADPYPILVVEVDHAPGHAPGEAALDAFQDALEDLTSKQRVILRVESDPRLGDGVDSRRGLVRLHRQTADLAPATAGLHGSGDVALLHVMYVAGRLDAVIATTISDEGVIAVFPEAFAGLERLDDGVRVPAEDLVETHALLHELGHAFGLVGEGIPMTKDRRAEDSGHSTNPASVMFRSVGIRDGLLLSGVSLHFDEDDLADLYAFRGERPPAPDPVVQVQYTRPDAQPAAAAQP